LKRKLLQPCRYVPAASFARHHELLSILNHKAHARTIIGEYRANIYSQTQGKASSQ
jgi:hypothetical protein